MAQGLSTPDPSLSPTHLFIKRGRATTTHYTHHQVSLNGVTQHYTSPFPVVAHWTSFEAGLSAGMRRERVPPQKRKKRRRTLCHRGMPSSGVCLSVRRSVRPSVTFVDSVETNKDIFKTILQSGSHTILVFPVSNVMSTPLTGFPSECCLHSTPRLTGR